MPKRKQNNPRRVYYLTAERAANPTDLHSWHRFKRHKNNYGKRTIMADSDMTSKSGDGERDNGNQKEAFMIPGVDGKLQFGFPTKIITILRYIQTNTLTSTTGGIATQVFRMNGPFDPDVTGIGHQPMYWDRYAAIYQSYRVLGSRITAIATPMNTNLANFGPYSFGINGSTSSSSLGTSNVNRMEQNDAISTTFSSFEGPSVLSFAYSPEIKLGRPAGDDTIGAFVSTNPTNQYYAHVWVNDDFGPASSLIKLKVELEYTIEFHGLVQEVES